MGKVNMGLFDSLNYKDPNKKRFSLFDQDPNLDPSANPQGPEPINLDHLISSRFDGVPQPQASAQNPAGMALSTLLGARLGQPQPQNQSQPQPSQAKDLAPRPDNFTLGDFNPTLKFGQGDSRFSLTQDPNEASRFSLNGANTSPAENMKGLDPTSVANNLTAGPKPESKWHKALSYLLPIIAGAFGAHANGEGIGTGMVAGGIGAFMGRQQGKQQAEEKAAAQKRQALADALKQSNADRDYKLKSTGLTPTSIRENEAFMNMSPEEQASFMKIKQASASPLAMMNYDYKVNRDRIEDARRAEEILDKRTERQNDLNEKSIQKLSDKLGNSQDLVNTFSDIDNALGFKLDDYDAKTGSVGGKKVDLPGVSVPGVGRVSFYSKEARALDNVGAKLFNLQIKDRSGATVTSNEMERIKNEWSSGSFNTEEEKMAALQRYKTAMHNTMRNIEAGFNQDVISTYKDRGGVTSDRIAPKGQKSIYKSPQATTGNLTSADRQAIEWAKANPTDPRAEKILQAHGGA